LRFAAHRIAKEHALHAAVDHEAQRFPGSRFNGHIYHLQSFACEVVFHGWLLMLSAKERNAKVRYVIL
jgi:hypothetical protein